MKKLLFLLLFSIVCIPSIVSSDSDNMNLSPMEVYQENYFIIGNKEDYAKFQFSAKYAFLKRYDTGVFVSYTQISFWDVYSNSSPFVETNYSPSFFIKSKYFWPEYFDYMQIGLYEHISNGEQKDKSRSVDRGYLQLQWSIGERINFGINAKGYLYYYQAPENKNYGKYTLYYEAKIFLSLENAEEESSKDEIYVKFRGGEKGYQEYGIITRKLAWMNPRLYIQFTNGYTTSLLNYEEKERSLRIGLIFK